MRHALALALVAGALAAPAAARAEDPLVVAVFVPNAPLGSVQAKAKLVSDLADALGAALGVKVAGRAYAHAEDLESDADEVAFALVDGAFAAQPKSPFSPLLAGQRGGRDRLAVYAAARVAAAWDLEGKRLAYVKVGRGTVPLVESFLFEGELPLGRVTRVPVPDAASALAALRLGQADAVVLSEAAFGALPGASAIAPRMLLASEELPATVLCLGGRAVPPDLLARARTALAGFSAPAAGIEGFVPLREGALDAVRRAVASPRKNRVPPLPEPTLRVRGPRLPLRPVELPRPALRDYLAPL